MNMDKEHRLRLPPNDVFPPFTGNMDAIVTERKKAIKTTQNFSGNIRWASYNKESR